MDNNHNNEESFKQNIYLSLGEEDTYSERSNRNTQDELESMIESRTCELSSEDLNSFHLILNDSDCSDSFFDTICNQLKEDGIEFRTTHNNEDIDIDNSVVITLDQQYNSGANPIIFAPYNNTRLGDSDSLTLAMQTSFQQHGFAVNQIMGGKMGFRADENGNILHIVPTKAEEEMDLNHNISFVTISLGTKNLDPELVAKCIENGLARQKYYLDNYDSGTDLIYRSNSGEPVQMVADYFSTSAHDLCAFNKLVDMDTLDSKTVVNPNIKHMDSFNKNCQFIINPAKTHTY